jgi:hypothetical protein
VAHRPATDHRVHGDLHRRFHHVLRPRDRQQAVHQAGQPGDLALHGGQLGGGGVISVLGEQVQPQPKRGERGTELMGDVGHHGLVTVDQCLEPSRHGVERVGEAAYLGRPVPGRGTGVQRAGAELLRCRILASSSASPNGLTR